MRGNTRAQWLIAAIASMRTTNASAAQIAMTYRPCAGTDVTGFGLAGHLQEMLDASGVAAVLRLEAIPALPGAHGSWPRMGSRALWHRIIGGFWGIRRTPRSWWTRRPRAVCFGVAGQPGVRLPSGAAGQRAGRRDDRRSGARARWCGPYQTGVKGLFAAKTQLRFMQKVGAEDGNVLLEPRQHGLADTERLDHLADRRRRADVRRAAWIGRKCREGHAER